jgi:hypothetical protein
MVIVTAIVAATVSAIATATAIPINNIYSNTKHSNSTLSSPE